MLIFYNQSKYVLEIQKDICFWVRRHAAFSWKGLIKAVTLHGDLLLCYKVKKSFP